MNEPGCLGWFPFPPFEAWLPIGLFWIEERNKCKPVIGGLLSAPLSNQARWGTDTWKQSPGSYPHATLLPFLGSLQARLYLPLGRTSQMWPKFEIRIVSPNAGTCVPPPDTGREHRGLKNSFLHLPQPSLPGKLPEGFLGKGRGWECYFLGGGLWQ